MEYLLYLTSIQFYFNFYNYNNYYYYNIKILRYPEISCVFLISGDFCQLCGMEVYGSEEEVLVQNLMS